RRVGGRRGGPGGGWPGPWPRKKGGRLPRTAWVPEVHPPEEFWTSGRPFARRSDMRKRFAPKTSRVGPQLIRPLAFFSEAVILTNHVPTSLAAGAANAGVVTDPRSQGLMGRSGGPPGSRPRALAFVRAAVGSCRKVS